MGTHISAMPFVEIVYKCFVHAGHGFGSLLMLESSTVACDKLVDMASAFESMP